MTKNQKEIVQRLVKNASDQIRSSYGKSVKVFEDESSLELSFQIVNHELKRAKKVDYQIVSVKTGKKIKESDEELESFLFREIEESVLTFEKTLTGMLTNGWVLKEEAK